MHRKVCTMECLLVEKPFLDLLERRLKRVPKVCEAREVSGDLEGYEPSCP
jgi:hypothetical protein